MPVWVAAWTFDGDSSSAGVHAVDSEYDAALVLLGLTAVFDILLTT